MPLMIYRARRKAGMTKQQFQDRWRQHGATAFDLPLWRQNARYCQGDILDDVPAGWGAAEDDYDGLCRLWFPDWKQYASNVIGDGPSIDLMMQDETETFGQFTFENIATYDDRALLDVGRNAFTSFVVIDGGSESVTETAAAAERAAQAVIADPASKQVLRKVVLDVYNSEFAYLFPNSEFKSPAVIELGTDAIADFERPVARLRAALADEGLADRAHFYFTRDVNLFEHFLRIHGRPHPRPELTV